MPRRNHCRLLKPQRVSQNFVENWQASVNLHHRDDGQLRCPVLLQLLDSDDRVELGRLGFKNIRVSLADEKLHGAPDVTHSEHHAVVGVFPGDVLEVDWHSKLSEKVRFQKFIVEKIYSDAGFFKEFLFLINSGTAAGGGVTLRPVLTAFSVED